MEEIKVKGIVLKAIDYKDSDKLITIFSPVKGLITARVRGVKKAKAKLAFAVQPFAFVEFMLSAKGGFYTVINATSIDQFFNITTDFDNYILMLACLEVCSKTVKENDVNEELFILLLNSLKIVCYKNVSAMVVFIKFMLEAMKYLGFAFMLCDCACCGLNLNDKFFAFSFDYNGMICSKCANKNDYLELSRGEFYILKNINDAEIDSLMNLKFQSRENLVSVISLLNKTFRINTDEEIGTIKQFL